MDESCTMKTRSRWADSNKVCKSSKAFADNQQLMILDQENYISYHVRSITLIPVGAGDALPFDSAQEPRRVEGFTNNICQKRTISQTRPGNCIMGDRSDMISIQQTTDCFSTSNPCFCTPSKTRINDEYQRSFFLDKNHCHHLCNCCTCCYT